MPGPDEIKVLVEEIFEQNPERYPGYHFVSAVNRRNNRRVQ